MREQLNFPKVEDNLPFSQTWPVVWNIGLSKFNSVMPYAGSVLGKLHPVFEAENNMTCSIPEPMKIYHSCRSGSIGMTDGAGYLTTAAIPIIQNYVTGGGHWGAAKIVLGEMVYGCVAESISNTLSQCARNTTIDGVKIDINNDQVNAMGNMDGVD